MYYTFQKEKMKRCIVPASRMVNISVCRLQQKQGHLNQSIDYIQVRRRADQRRENVNGHRNQFIGRIVLKAKGQLLHDAQLSQLRAVGVTENVRVLP